MKQQHRMSEELAVRFERDTRLAAPDPAEHVHQQLPEAAAGAGGAGRGGGYSYRETAALMGTPVGTVMSWLHRGRSALRVRLSTAS